MPGRGILPIATSQDCAGPMCRTVADAAALLGVLAGETYGEGSGPDTLRGVRLALPPEPDDLHAQEAEVFHAALDVLRERGAVLVEVPALPETDEFPVLIHEFARDLDAYLATLPEGAPIRIDARARRVERRARRPALKFGQVLLEQALAVDHDAEHAAYVVRRARDLAVAGEHGIDATLAIADAAAIVFPGPHGCGFAARAGYPSLVVPAGYRREGRRPVGLTFVGPSRSEGLLLSLGAAYEEAAQVRRPPSVVNPSLFVTGPRRRRISGHWVSRVARWVVPGATSSAACGNRSVHQDEAAIALASSSPTQTVAGQRTSATSKSQGRVSRAASRR